MTHPHNASYKEISELHPSELFTTGFDELKAWIKINEESLNGGLINPIIERHMVHLRACANAMHALSKDSAITHAKNDHPAVVAMRVAYQRAYAKETNGGSNASR